MHRQGRTCHGTPGSHRWPLDRGQHWWHVAPSHRDHASRQGPPSVCQNQQGGATHQAYCPDLAVPSESMEIRKKSSQKNCVFNVAGNPITGTGLQDAVNQLLFAINLFHKLLYINWFALTNFLQSSLIIYTCNVRTPFEQGLDLTKRYSQWKVSREPHKNVSRANKILFTELHSFNLRIGPVLFRLTIGNTLVMECKYFKLEKQNF